MTQITQALEALISELQGSARAAERENSYGDTQDEIKAKVAIEEFFSAALSSAAPPAQQAASEPVAWLPTAENINALPAPVRDYIHSLIANCDPAGNVADNTIKADTIRALEASNRRIRDELDTPGNRNPEARYAGYRGEPALERYTADELAAWEEGQRARVPASKSVAGLSGDAEREALTEEQIEVLLPPPAHHNGFGRHPDLWTKEQVVATVRAALHSTGKPDELPLVAECPCCGATLTREDAATADAPVAEPVLVVPEFRSNGARSGASLLDKFIDDNEPVDDPREWRESVRDMLAEVTGRQVVLAEDQE